MTLTGKIEISPAFLKQKFHISERKLLEIYRFCNRKLKLLFTFSEKNWKFDCPKLLDLKDNYSYNFKVASKKPSNHKEVEEEEEEEVEEEKPKKDIYTLFDFWNSCNIVKHRELEKYKSYMEKILKYYPLEEIKKTIQNYRDILDSDKHYFSHKWSLDEFFSRKAGFDKFHDDNNPFSQWLNDKKQPIKYDEQSF